MFFRAYSFLLAVSSWRWNSCFRENRDYFGKATSKEIRRAWKSELIYYATIHWLSTKLENNRDDSQDDVELALNLKPKDFSSVNKHSLLRPNSKTEWSMWYAGKIERQHSNCVDQISELFAFPGKLSTEITLPDYKVRIPVKKLSKTAVRVPNSNQKSNQTYVWRWRLWRSSFSNDESALYFPRFSLIRIWLVQTFRIFLIGWNGFVFSLLTARRRANKDGFRETSSLKFPVTVAGF